MPSAHHSTVNERDSHRRELKRETRGSSRSRGSLAGSSTPPSSNDANASDVPGRAPHPTLVPGSRTIDGAAYPSGRALDTAETRMPPDRFPASFADLSRACHGSFAPACQARPHTRLSTPFRKEPS